MQILENRSLFMENMISYRTNLPKEDIPKLADHICRNVSALGVEPTKKICFTYPTDEKKDIEILVPVIGDISSHNEYGHKELFRLINAVTIRHEGSLADIDTTEKKLVDYVRKRSYEMITRPYYNIVRLADNPADCIVDIYIGTNYNKL
ncbi:MAG: hypothetical protein IKI56_10425 [Ruminococcus sp.]|nr:hypothetical protein [Ruminococcus sp.]